MGVQYVSMRRAKAATSRNSPITGGHEFARGVRWKRIPSIVSSSASNLPCRQPVTAATSQPRAICALRIARVRNV
jgi:hypothetical protein